MNKLLIIFLISIIPQVNLILSTNASENPEIYADEESLYEAYQNAEIDFTTYENLLDLHRHPINLNSNNEILLLIQIPHITYGDVLLICNYLNQAGEFESIDELNNITGLDIESILPYVIVEDISPIASISPRLHYHLEGQIQDELQDRSDNTSLGYSRHHFKGHIRYGTNWKMEFYLKRRGEDITHIKERSITYHNKISTNYLTLFSLGNYRLNIAKGLVLGSSQYNTEISNPTWQEQLYYTDSSLPHYNNGLLLRLSIRNWFITLLTSHNLLEKIILTDNNELKSYTNMYASNLLYQFSSSLQIGFSGLYLNLQRHYQGQNNILKSQNKYILGIHSDLNYSNLTFFTELAREINEGSAMIIGLRNYNKGLSFEAFYRYYANDYTNPYNSAYSGLDRYEIIWEDLSLDNITDSLLDDSDREWISKIAACDEMGYYFSMSIPLNKYLILETNYDNWMNISSENNNYIASSILRYKPNRLWSFSLYNRWRDYDIDTIGDSHYSTSLGVISHIIPHWKLAYKIRYQEYRNTNNILKQGFYNWFKIETILASLFTLQSRIKFYEPNFYSSNDRSVEIYFQQKVNIRKRTNFIFRYTYRTYEGDKEDIHQLRSRAVIEF